MPVLIRSKNPYFHSTIYCSMAAGSTKNEKAIPAKLDDLIVTTQLRALTVHKKTRCSSQACSALSFYDYRECENL